jgi:hypothetical protein
MSIFFLSPRGPAFGDTKKTTRINFCKRKMVTTRIHWEIKIVHKDINIHYFPLDDHHLPIMVINCTEWNGHFYIKNFG